MYSPSESTVAEGPLATGRIEITLAAQRQVIVDRRQGVFSKRLGVGYEQKSRPLAGVCPAASLNRRYVRSASLSSASSQPQATAGMRKLNMAARVRGQPAPLVTDAACQRPGEVQAAFEPVQREESAVQQDQAAIEGGVYLLALDG